MPLRRLPSISSAEPSTPPAMGVASLEEVKDKKNSLEKSWQDSKQVRNSGLIDWESYECQLVTPLFGGGVVAGQVDKRMPIRASAIRGQLRFWWRLLASKRLNNPEEIRAEEFALWGGLGTPPQASRVWVEVRHDESPKLTEAKNINSYALGGAKKSEVEIYDCLTPWVLRIGYCPSLSDKQKQEVQDTVRWWASFGGVGARTRRGFGAVWSKDITVVSVKEASKLGIDIRLISGQPTSPEEALNKPAKEVWIQAIERLAAFRQGKNCGRNPGGEVPGRSRWPEASNIRTATNKYRVKADDTSFKPEFSSKWYPRALFGLPIVFQFKNIYKDKHKNDDPKQEKLIEKDINHDVKSVTLGIYKQNEPDTAGRMASPIILRPYWNPDTSIWQAACILLPVEEASLAQLALWITKKETNGGMVKRSIGSYAIPRKNQHKEEHRILQTLQSPLLNYQSHHPLTAFLDFFEEKPA